ncbi:MAG: FAD-dependent oxidoreductase [Gammaproteobacteria bacterium]|nr:FAD-dependent oxidoreductase [Gammaproteobacteria bacterium]MCY4226481.1 FAD-dependent oxidoreductase [Gammaproteobacteria bacterium]
MNEVAIIGAGVAGLTCACELVDRGIDISIYEQSERLGGTSCSWFAGGMLAPYCERDTAEHEVMQRGLVAAKWWQKHITEVIQKGSLVLALPRDRNELERLSRLGKQCRWVDQSQIEDIEPDLADFSGPGLLFPEEAHLNPRKALQDLANYLEMREISIQFDQAVRIEDLDAKIVLDCRGYHSHDTLPRLRGVKGEMMILRTRDLSLARPVRLLHPRQPIYMVPREDHQFMLGATLLENNERARFSVRSMLDLLNSAVLLSPSFGEAEIVESAADIRPAFDDNIPRLYRKHNVVFVNGLYRHGFLLGPSLAIQAAEAVLNPKQWQELPRCA